MMVHHSGHHDLIDQNTQLRLDNKQLRELHIRVTTPEKKP